MSNEIQLLREQFWHEVYLIRDSREKPKDDEAANKQYGEARNRLMKICAKLAMYYDDFWFEMEDDDGESKVWHTYL